jgi:hypothetical protein
MTRLYVDFHNTNEEGAVRLNTIGSIKDLNLQGIALEDGLVVHLYSEDFEVTGTVKFAAGERSWAAYFNWDDLRSTNAKR